MLIDFHTHFSNKSSDYIFNVILNETTVKDTSWLKEKMVSVGIHPRFIKEDKINEYLKFQHEISKDNRIKYIGECGLDKLTEIDFSLQMRVFEQQIKLAEELKKPLVIHCVKAFGELIEEKKKIEPQSTWIVHGFNKNIAVAHSLLKHDIRLSFGAALIKRKELQEVFKEIPIEKVFLETDHQEMYSIKEMYHMAAKIKGLDSSVLENYIKENYKKLCLI